MYICIYIYIYMHINTHIYMLLNIYMYTYVCMRINISLYLYSVNEEFKRNLAQESSAASMIETNMKAGHDSLKIQIVTLESTNRMLEEKLEIEVASNQDAVTAIRAAASNLRNNEDFLQIGYVYICVFLYILRCVSIQIYV
jgi:dGTP triphosphohydrolase